MSTPLLELNEVNTYYGHIHALKGISLTIDQGEIVTLLGANGAGKTTTLRTISGLIHPRKGDVKLNGQTISNVPAHKIAAMGLGHVPEGRGIFPKLTVRENLDMGAFLVKDQRLIRQRLEVVFEHFPRLKERLQQKGGTLSGGEQQMLAIGRGLMVDPDIMLLDEPSMGLAPILVEEIFNIIQQINAKGKSILLVEQNAQMALSIAHRGYVLETGRIALEGASDTLLHNPRVMEVYLGG
jgi:branched-chain amino acid transport system ATP-binding protein